MSSKKERGRRSWKLADDSVAREHAIPAPNRFENTLNVMNANREVWDNVTAGSSDGKAQLADGDGSAPFCWP